MSHSHRYRCRDCGHHPQRAVTETRKTAGTPQGRRPPAQEGMSLRLPPHARDRGDMSDLYDEFLDDHVFEQEAAEWALTPEGKEAFMQTERGGLIWRRYQRDTAEDDAIERVRRNADEDLPL